MTGDDVVGGKKGLVGLSVVGCGRICGAGCGCGCGLDCGNGCGRT